MAINFPATGGQATDGSFTYTVAGIVYAWNGSSWQAAGAGASATDRSLFSVTTNSANATPALSYNNNTGVFTYTPPLPESDTFDDVVGRGNIVLQDVIFGDYNNTSGAPKITYDDSVNTLWFKCPSLAGDSASINLGNGNSYNNLEIKTTQSQAQLVTYNADLFLATYTSNKNIVLQTAQNTFLQVDSYDAIKVLENGVNNGAGLSVELYWGSTSTAGGIGGKKLETTSTGISVLGTVDATAFVGDGTGITNVTSSTARATVSATNSIASNGVANISLTTPKTYALLSIETSHSAWVTLYSDTASRTADANRTETTDPVAGSGVLAEVITTGNQTQIITPGVICFNSSSSNVTYAKIVNKSGGTANVQVTLTYVQIEA